MLHWNSRVPSFAYRGYVKFLAASVDYNLLFKNGLREFLAGGKAHSLLRGYFDGFAVARIDAFASCTLAHFKGAKAYQTYFVAILQGLADSVDEVRLVGFGSFKVRKS